MGFSGHKNLVLAILLLYGICLGTSAVPLSSFFPYGVEHGDILAPKSDDGSNFFRLSSPFGFSFFNVTYNQLWVNNNGAISFKRAIGQYTPVCNAIDETSTMIAPFWGDVDNRNGGDIFFRETSNRTLLSKAATEIQTAFPEFWGMSSASLFIATWSNVSFFGKQQGVCGDKRNTFQVILSTDGVYSFAIFNYYELTWTTGTASSSGGDSCGLGGVPAKAGFDVGDGETFYTIPGSCTPQVLDLAQTSNVNSSGKWIFRVDGAFQSSGQCDSDKYRDSKLRLSPSFVGPFGHVPLTIKGPCFDSVVSATCRFNDEGFDGTHTVISATNMSALVNYNSNEPVAICQVPYLYSYGRISVDLFVVEDKDGDGIGDNEIQYTGYLYTMEMDADLSAEISEDVDSEGKIPVTVNWNPDFFKHADADQDQNNPLNLEVILLEFNTTESKWKERQVIKQNVTSTTGKIRFCLNPEGLQEAIAFRIKEIDFSSVLTSMKSAFTKVKHGMLKSKLEKNRRRCDDWYESDPGPPTDIEPCPPLLSQAQSDARFEKDGNDASLQDFHPGAAFSFRQKIPSPSGSGQQCVYDKEGKIMVGPPGGGTADLSSPVKWWKIPAHFIDDVIPWNKCCKLSQSEDHCRKYYEKRPSDSGENYLPPRPAGGSGDPHITTFDNLAYSFNGVGEFWMAKSSANTLNFSMQARMEQYINPESGPTNASIFTAFVMSDGQNRIQVQYSGQRGLDLFLNGEIIDSQFPSSSSSLSNSSALRVSTRTANIEKIETKDGAGASAQISFNSGFSFNITLVQDQKSLSVLASSSQRNQGKTVGLLGYFDGNPENDLQVDHVNGSTSTIPSNSSLEKIHKDFGLQWMIKEEESLFLYPEGRNYNDYSRPEFIPNFKRPEVSSLPDNILQMCGGSQDCLFDYAVTGNENFAKGTKEQTAVLNETVNALEKEVEMCSSIQKLENGYVTTTNFFEDSKVNFTCNKGFKLNGVQNVTCIKNDDAGSGSGAGSKLKWSEEKPTCVKSDGGGSSTFYPSLLLVFSLSYGILKLV